MSEVTIQPPWHLAWRTISLVESQFSESGDLIVLNNSSGVVAPVSGLSDAQQIGEIRRVINRGNGRIEFKAEDAAAPAKDRFTTAFDLEGSTTALIFYNGSRWEKYTEA